MNSIRQGVRPEIESWNWDRLKQYLASRKGYSEDKIDELLQEYKRYMEMNARFPSKRLPISPEVDEVWHAHILDTPGYRSFCQEAIGHFVDHRPSLSDAERDSLLPEYESNTLRIYEMLFGAAGPYWPRACVCKCAGNE